jgi:hypothetical protein
MISIKKLSTYLFQSTTVLLIAAPLTLLMEWILVQARYCSTSIGWNGSSWIIRLIANLPLPGNMFTHAYRTIHTPAESINLQKLAWTGMHYLLCFSADILNMASLVVSLVILHCLFKKYKDGEFFSSYTASLFQYLSMVFFIDALIIHPLIDTLLVACATISNLPGNRYVVVSFGSTNVSVLWHASIILLLSLIMSEASKLSDEQQLTV